MPSLRRDNAGAEITVQFASVHAVEILDSWGRPTLGDRIQLVGDDILVTNPAIVAEAIDRGIANAALITVNQVGTVTETLETTRICARPVGRRWSPTAPGRLRTRSSPTSPPAPAPAADSSRPAPRPAR
jgi:hypothetical protein